jgi:hypothetical protein
MALVVGALAGAGVARANSVRDYPRLADAGVQANGHGFRIFVMDSRNTVLIEPAPADMNRAGLYWPDDDWRAAANAVVQPFGCAVARMARLTRDGPAWEATYYCPLGTDLAARVRQQAAAKTAEPAKP